MKSSRLILTSAFLVIWSASFSQSKSFEALRDNFAGEEGVHHVRVSGVFCRAVLWMAGEWEFKEAISDVSSIRVINIPKQTFRVQKLSVSGFRTVLHDDHFESLATVKEPGEQVEVYLQEQGNHSNRYLVIVEEAEEVTVIEVKGYIDIQKLKDLEKKNSLSYQQL
jgi:hypothetical protein